MARDEWAGHLAEHHLLMLKTVKTVVLAKAAAAWVHLCQVEDCDTW